MKGQNLQLSICIASYGNDVTALLDHLQNQCKGLPEAEIDIHISDQFPTAHTCATDWTRYPNTFYHHNQESTGRAANRNFLARVARGTQLLFLDADSLPVESDFLQRYLEVAEENLVVVGGTAYQRTTDRQLLRYKVGVKKEEIPVAKRKANPYGSFTAFNALIPRAVFEKIPFDSSLVEYGHEDTLFGLELRHHVIPVLHIDNPAYHLGLDDNTQFMIKTRQAVDSLASLISKGKIDEEVRLFDAYMRWSKFGGHFVLRTLYDAVGEILFQRLSSGEGNVLLFDFYKLLRLCHQQPKVGNKMP